MKIISQLTPSLILFTITLVVVQRETASAQAIHGAPIKPAGEVAAKPDSPTPNPSETNGTPAIKSASTNQTAKAAAAYPFANFDDLGSYVFNVPEDAITNQVTLDKVEKQIPATIMALDAKKASVAGFMMPVTDVGGRTTEFLIMKNQASCCFGGMMRINDFVIVRAPGKGFEVIMDQPVTVQGTLHVGAFLQNGYIAGIYEMDAERLIERK